jgi:multiple sugar transport system permease protein
MSNQVLGHTRPDEVTIWSRFFGNSRDRRDNIQAYLFLAPFMVVYIIFIIYPVIQAAYMSFFKWDLLAPHLNKFIGLRNYTSMFSDSIFWTSFSNTLEFVLLSTPLIVGVGLLLALLLNRSDKIAAFFRTVYFAPYVFSVAVLTLIWGFLLNPQSGILAEFLSLFNIEPISWLTNPQLAMPAIVITTLWWTMGFNMVLFLAGLQDIDGSLYEAAELDGAGTWAQFRHITIPGLQRTILLVVILQVIASFQIFGQVYIMTRGGPGGTTRVLIQYIYESGFRDFQLGYAAAMSLVLFIVMLLVSYLQFRFTPQED